MTRRIEKVNSLLRREISQAILKEIDFGDTLVTITDINTNRNLLESEILITVLPQEKEKEALRVLKNNIYDIQKIIDKRLKMRPVPKICFRIDEGMKNFYKIDSISREGKY